MYKSRGDWILFAAGVVVLAGGITFSLTRGRGGFSVTNLVFTQWWGGEMEGGALEELAGEFEALHPGVKIVLDTRPRGEVRGLLFQEAVGGEAAPLGDVVGLESLWALPLRGAGAVEAAGEPPRLVTSVYLLFYNIDVLKEAGFSRPPKTRSEFLAMARKARDEGTGRGGLGAAPEAGNPAFLYEDIYPWFYAGGAGLLEEGRPATSGRGVRETFEFLKTLSDEGLLAAAAPGGESAWERKARDFAAGRSAFMIAPAEAIRALEGRMASGSFGVTGVPTPDAYVGKPVFAATAWSAAVSAGSGHKEEAASFINFLAERSAFLAEKAGALQVDGGIGVEGGAGGGSSLYEKAESLCALADIVEEFDSVPENAALEAAFREALGPLFLGEATAAQTAERVTEEWGGILGVEARD